jgi:hypothetical protein
MRSYLLVLPLALLGVACRRTTSVSVTQRQQIVAALTRQVKDAYDLAKPDVPKRLLSLYPDTGRIVSASGGRIITSRDTLAMGIKAFWDYVGVNMHDPTWVWDKMLFDVLSPTTAVMTASYRVPHHQPNGEAHVIGGAWTAVFQKRGTRWVIVQEHLSDLPAMADTMRMKMP